MQYPFFEIIAQAGIKQRELARRMNQDPSVLTHVKNGKTPSYRFMDGAARALRDIGLRKADGSHYTVDELFFPPLSNPLHEASDVLHVAAGGS
jgi:transcriptional regulator with XRE-family HTH domain